MAAKKTGKKRRTKAQIAATERLVKANKKRAREKKKGKKAKKSKAKKRAGGCPPAVAHEVKRLVDANARLRSELAVAKKRKTSKKKTSKKKAGKKKTAKKRASKKTNGKAVRTVTAASILKGAARGGQRVWVCAGRIRTGCGGGKKTLQGSRVVGVLR